MHAPGSRRLLAGAAFLLTVACHDGQPEAVARPFPDAPPVANAPCPLGGVWQVRLVNRLDSTPHTTGWIALSQMAPDAPNDAVWIGRYAIRLEPLFRSGEARIPWTSVVPESEGDDYTDAWALLVAGGDSVVIGLSTEMTHGPPDLHGTLRGDSIVGRWAVRGADPGTGYGPFAMSRREGCVQL